MAMAPLLTRRRAGILQSNARLWAPPEEVGNITERGARWPLVEADYLQSATPRESNTPPLPCVLAMSQEEVANPEAPLGQINKLWGVPRLAPASTTLVLAESLTDLPNSLPLSKSK